LKRQKKSKKKFSKIKKKFKEAKKSGKFFAEKEIKKALEKLNRLLDEV
jgi:hypothetical protein